MDNKVGSVDFRDQTQNWKLQRHSAGCCLSCRSALADPHVWGEGADSTFRVRRLEEYEKPLAIQSLIRSVADFSRIEILILEF